MLIQSSMRLNTKTVKKPKMAVHKDPIRFPNISGINEGMFKRLWTGHMKSLAKDLAGELKEIVD